MVSTIKRDTVGSPTGQKAFCPVAVQVLSVSKSSDGKQANYWSSSDPKASYTPVDQSALKVLASSQSYMNWLEVIDLDHDVIYNLKTEARIDTNRI